jgi:hypothetical protein
MFRDKSGVDSFQVTENTRKTILFLEAAIHPNGRSQNVHRDLESDCRTSSCDPIIKTAKAIAPKIRYVVMNNPSK